MKTLITIAILLMSLSLSYGQFIDGGINETYILCNDGYVWATGRNDFGQLGNGSSSIKLEPFQTSIISKIIMVSGGLHHAMALDSSGNVWTWGWNSSGQLGDGTTNNRYVPIQIFSGAKSISGGDYHSVVLKKDGTVWAWGKNTNGQLGNNSTTVSYSAVQVQGLTNITAISTESNHNLALKNDGTVWAWGYNYTGCIGDGSSGAGSDKLVPVKVSNISNVIDIDAGNNYSLALDNNGYLWSWGDNYYGELGTGNTTELHTPTQVQTNVIDIAAGKIFSLLLKNDSTVWACGSNDAGQLGNGQILWAAHPNFTQVLGINKVRYIASGSAHSLAIKNDGTAWAWGYNSSGQIGDSTTTDRTSPTEMHLDCKICTNDSCFLSNLSVGIKTLESSFGSIPLVYPNPTKGALTILMGSKYNLISTKLINVFGQIVNSQVYGNTDQFNVDIKTPKGIYYLEIIASSEKRFTFKIIKE